MQTGLQAKRLLENRDQEVGADRRPDLDAHGVVGSAHERADAQMLFYPTEEEFDLPAGLVDLGDLERRKREVIGQKDERTPLLWIDSPALDK